MKSTQGVGMFPSRDRTFEVVEFLTALGVRSSTARASQYEGEGGPTDKVLSARRANPGMDDPDIDFTASPIDEGHEQEAPRPRAASSGAGGGRHVVVHDPLREGEDAARANRRGSTSHPHYKGEDYYVPESVPDSISAEGNIPPDSIIQASRETEGYDRT